jgi:hypothetical protein
MPFRVSERRDREIVKPSAHLLLPVLQSVSDPISKPTEDPQPDPGSRRELITSYVWLIGRNLLGWILILASFIAGPLVPGPGGIPMFLVGFAMISFPGKRHLTARILRGRVFHFWSLRMLLITIVWAVALPGAVLWIFGNRWDRLVSVYDQGPLAIVSVYVAGVVISWVIALAALRFANMMVRWHPRVRRRVRPWLRRHHIRLLPPRWRRRHPNEAGQFPKRIRVKDEVISFIKHRREKKS